MKIREFFVETIGYKLFPCLYNRFHGPLFDFIKSKIPGDFLNRSLYDLGCGDGENTVRLQNAFLTKEIVACDRSEPMLERARKKGLKTQQLDFNDEFPKGEMAAFIYSLHHAYNKEEVLQKAKNNFQYLFICEPYLNLLDFLNVGFMNIGHVPTRKNWLVLFDKALGDYELYEYKSNLIIFYTRK
ncbi:MAG: hypothetical protein A2570_01625 [Candidatus Brennerbacteria bacterium RIFOXYD1_FULL_41_16]|uniref:Methyltransferase domain-containing protein n=1 Tax=Candidatus Brennerbacteria bacterium RIFOXYD1_FULL_41_16 TaxID=1797529 RepID=A0A1G1XLL0_9BACT|nr:MAG: hypothetical protein A2570_01625 [Candidatus Brennerbacteria bacterium RIFOXYD1_FULL_41_16]